jgi:hypothetical protein
MALRVLLPILFARCSYTLPTNTPDTENANDHNPDNWSREAILTLVGVCTAVACFIVGLAWPRLRLWLCKLPEGQLVSPIFSPPSMSNTPTVVATSILSGLVPSRLSTITIRDNGTRRPLQEEYQEWLEFNEWLEIRRTRSQ